PEPGPAWDEIGLEAFDALVKDLEVALAPPFAVGKNVDAGSLLEGDGERDRLVADALPLRRRGTAGQVILEDIQQAGGAREAANHRGREERQACYIARHTSGAFSPGGREIDEIAHDPPGVGADLVVHDEPAVGADLHGNWITPIPNRALVGIIHVARQPM